MRKGKKAIPQIGYEANKLVRPTSSAQRKIWANRFTKSEANVRFYT